MLARRGGEAKKDVARTRNTDEHIYQPFFIELVILESSVSGVLYSGKTVNCVCQCFDETLKNRRHAFEG